MGKGSCKASVVSLKTVQMSWNGLAYFVSQSGLLSPTGENHRFVPIGFTMYSLSSTSTAFWNHSLFPSQFNLPFTSGSFSELSSHPSSSVLPLTLALWAELLISYITEVTGPWTGKSDFLPPNLQKSFPVGPPFSLLSCHSGREKAFPPPRLRIPWDWPTLLSNTRLALLLQVPLLLWLLTSSQTHLKMVMFPLKNNNKTNQQNPKTNKQTLKALFLFFPLYSSVFERIVYTHSGAHWYLTDVPSHLVKLLLPKSPLTFLLLIPGAIPNPCFTWPPTNIWHYFPIHALFLQMHSSGFHNTNSLLVSLLLLQPLLILLQVPLFLLKQCFKLFSSLREENFWKIQLKKKFWLRHIIRKKEWFTNH